MTRDASNGFWLSSLTGVMAAIGVVASYPFPTLAQITPDQTLGAESSRITPNVDVRGGMADRIDGGAIRGVNLFHSFQDFNVRELQRVYFANPQGIENILGRVTGSTRSNILGTLGVDGGANLFLINPNGIIFGPNAKLDIRGSFLAGTADGFKFPDGSEFRAKDPNAPPLVTVNIPIGLQYGPEPPAALVSKADLEVGQDLMLSGGRVTSSGKLSATEGKVVVEGVDGNVRVQDVTAQSATLLAKQDVVLEESQLRTTGDMNLLAKGTVRIRDSVEKPFQALAGGNLLIQGNESIDILALNHPETPFQTRGNLTLVSDGNVSGDAHFYSGGDFSILNLAGKPGTFVSKYDPIISVTGNVTIGDYTGVALKIEATGSITTGNITITGPETFPGQAGNGAAIGNVTPTTGGGLISTGSGSVSAPALSDFLSTENLNNGTLTSGTVFNGSGFTTTFSAVADQPISFEWNFLTNETPPSSFYNDLAFISLQGPDGVQPVLGTAFNNGPQTNFLGLNKLTDTGFPNTSGAGFKPSTVPGFNQETGTQTFSATLNTPGEYKLSIGVTNVGDSDTNFNSGLQVNNFNLGNNPPINIVVTNDPDKPILGSTPALILKAGVDPAVVDKAQGSQGNFSGFPGNVPPTPTLPAQLPGNLTINGNINTSGPIAGSVTLSASGNISLIGRINANSTDGNNNGGSVSITADKAVLLTGTPQNDGTVLPNSIVNRPAGTGTGGNILIQGESVDLNNFGLDPATFGNGTTGSTTITANKLDPNSTNPNAGRVFLSKGIIYGDNYSQDNSSRGGNISLQGDAIILDGYTLNTINNGQGTGGSISLNADNTISIVGNSRITTQNLSGGSGGSISLAAQDISVQGGSQITSANSGNKNGGSISLDAKNAVVIAGATDQQTKIDAGTSSASLTGIGGEISITGNSIDLTNNVLVDASTTGAAKGGNVLVDANKGLVSISDTSTISTAVNATDGSTATGLGGNITLQGTGIKITNNSSVSAGTNSTGNSGSILLTANGGSVELDTGKVTTSSTSQDNTAGNAGNIEITGTSVILNHNSEITAQTTNGIQNILAPGNISLINLNTLEVNDSLISVSTDKGRAGNVNVNAAKSVVLNGTLTDGSGRPAGLFATAQQGKAGDLTITTPIFTVQNGAQAAVSTTSSTGLLPAGSLKVNAGSISLTNQAALKADSTASTQGGSITLQGIPAGLAIAQQPLESLKVIDSLVSASTQSGKAGDVIVDTTNSVELSGAYTVAGKSQPAGLLAQATDGGNAGSLKISTNQLTIDKGASAAASSNGAGNAGEITVKANQVALNNGGQIIAETQAGGATAPANITLEGLLTPQLQTLEVNNGLISSSTDSGVAGYIFINALDSVKLSGTLPNDSKGGVVAEAKQGGSAGDVTIVTNQLSIDKGASAAASSNGAGNAGKVTIDANAVTLNSGGQITAETEGGGKNAPAIINLIGLDTLALNNGFISSSTKTGVAGNVLLDVSDSVTLSNNGSISSSSTSGKAGSVLFNPLQTLTVTNGLISSSTESGEAGSVKVTDSGTVTLSGTFTNTDGTKSPGGVVAKATEGGNAGGISIKTDQLLIDNGAAATASSEGVKRNGTSGNAGDVTITANAVTLNSGGQITAETEGGGKNAPAIINLIGLDTLALNNGLISSSTKTGVAGDVLLDVSGLVTLSNNGSISSSSTSGKAGSVLFNPLQTLTVTNGLISSSTESGKAGSVKVTDSGTVTLSGTFTNTDGTKSPGGVVAKATQGGNAGGVSIKTDQLTIDNGAAATASSEKVKPDGTSGNAGDVTITANAVKLNSGGQITAETEGGGATAPANITLQGLKTLELNDGTISASTNTGVAGSLSINASDSVKLDEGSRIAVRATGENGTAGNLTINTGDFLVRDGSEVSVSSKQGFAGNLNVNAGFIGLNRGSITAEAGQGQGGANIELNTTGFLRLDNESLISALATGNATGGNIKINAQYILVSFPTGPQGSDIVADAILGNGGQISINALGIFGIQFRPLRTPLNDITASSQGGASGTVQLTTLGIDPSRGLAALPLNFVDASGLVGGQCSARNSADGEQSQFTITGRGGLPLNPTDPLGPDAEQVHWVSLDSKANWVSLSPEVATQMRITPFNSAANLRQLAQFPVLCYQSWLSPTAKAQ